MIEVGEIIKSGVLYQVWSVIALGEDWFKDMKTGICYHATRKDGEILIDNVRYSRDKPKSFIRYPKTKERQCQNCKKVYRDRAQGHYKYCKDCREVVARKQNTARQTVWRMKQKVYDLKKESNNE